MTTLLIVATVVSAAGALRAERRRYLRNRRRVPVKRTIPAEPDRVRRRTREQPPIPNGDGAA